MVKMYKLKSKENIIGALNSFNSIRGIIALWIVIGHCSMEYEQEIMPLFLIHKFNLVWVGVFFFLSGWGLELSVNRKDNYLKGFLFQKVVSILAMTIAVWLFQVVLLSVFGFREYDFTIRALFQDYLISTNWYMWELLFFYIVFYFSRRYIKDSHVHLLCVSCVALGIVLFLPFTDIGPSYYFSSMGFPAGICLYQYRGIFEKWFKKHSLQILICLHLVSAACLLSLLLPQKNSISALGKNIMCISVSMIGVIIFMYISLKGRLLKFLTKISPEIYLYQFPILTIYKEIWERNGRDVGMDYVMTVTCTTIVVAIIVHYAFNAVKRKIVIFT